MEFLNKSNINTVQSNKKNLAKRAKENVEETTVIQEPVVLDTKNILLLSTNAEFYKTFLFNGWNISVYINVSKPEYFYVVLTVNKTVIILNFAQ